MHTDLLPHHHGEEEHHNIDQIRAQLAKADNFQIVADIFKQVGDPTRVRIFWLRGVRAEYLRPHGDVEPRGQPPSARPQG